MLNNLKSQSKMMAQVVTTLKQKCWRVMIIFMTCFTFRIHV